MRSRIKQYMVSFFGFFYPDLCLGCQQELHAGEDRLCTRCMYHMPIALPHRISPNPMMNLFFGRVAMTQATCLFYYHKASMVQQLLHQLKYGGREEIGDYFAELLHPYLVEDQLFKNVDFVVPVPLHLKRRRKRGYNQVHAFAKSVATSIGKPIHTSMLTKTKNTVNQARLQRQERIKVQSGVFKAQSMKVQPQHILLVDDVTTTGSTLTSCAQALQAAYGCEVSILTMAMAQ